MDNDLRTVRNPCVATHALPGTNMTAPAASEKKSILHICRREVIRPIRDQILALSGFEVESTHSIDEAIDHVRQSPPDLVLVDVEGEAAVPEAEHLCSQIKTIHPDQLVAFVCNWRVAFLTDCPDEILRTEFDPAAFVAGVRKTLEAA
jgi:DNA-binding NarL/FixJ family response regulator